MKVSLLRILTMLKDGFLHLGYTKMVNFQRDQLCPEKKV